MPYSCEIKFHEHSKNVYTPKGFTPPVKFNRPKHNSIPSNFKSLPQRNRAAKNSETLGRNAVTSKGHLTNNGGGSVLYGTFQTRRPNRPF